jgi:hypothetical protein
VLVRRRTCRREISDKSVVNRLLVSRRGHFPTR